MSLLSETARLQTGREMVSLRTGRGVSLRTGNEILRPLTGRGMNKLQIGRGMNRLQIGSDQVV